MAGVFLGLKGTAVALAGAVFLGGVIGGLLILTKIKGRRDHMPFGPFLALGCFISLFYADQLISWYVFNFL